MNNKLKPFGFILSDKPGKGKIKRFYNTGTTVVAPVSKTIQRINMVQEVMPFEEAFMYIKEAAEKHNLSLKHISCQNYKEVKNPIRKAIIEALKN